MTIERGSTWNKWDFHVHTPYSVLNNQFGINPYGEDGEFDEYVRQLFAKAIQKGVVAIGITDYFSIDGYKRLYQDYLHNPDNLKRLFPDEKTRNAISAMYIFPSIEMRLDNFVGEKNHAVNYHIIFSDQLSPDMIEEYFLHNLVMKNEYEKSLKLTRKNIEYVGKQYKEYNKANGDDYYVGLNRIVVSSTDIINVLSNTRLLEGQYFIAVPPDEDLSKISWAGRYYATKKNLYKQADFLMTSNKNTRDWALAKGREKEQIEEFRSIKPCIWGSDAHSFETIFSPAEERYCWVKANPSFDGLKQLLYEPEDRVRIQATKPEEKDPHQVIDYVRFHSSDFPKVPIYLNEGLSVIIGGKSTGKTTLLRNIAQAVDSAQVKRRDKYVPSSIIDETAEVVWCDGASGDRKIVYIPQSWLDRIVDERSGRSELHSMIQEILLQQEQVEIAYKKLVGTLSVKRTFLKQEIDQYVKSIEFAHQYEQELKEVGRSDAFLGEIKQLEIKRDELSLNAGISEEGINQLRSLEKSISEAFGTVTNVESEKKFLEELSVPEIVLPMKDKGFLSEVEILEEAPLKGGILKNTIDKINETVAELWSNSLNQVLQELSSEAECHNERLKNLLISYEPLKKKMEADTELQRIEEKLREERECLRSAISREKKKEESIKKAKESRDRIMNSRSELIEAYNSFKRVVDGITFADTELVFEVSIQCKKEALFDSISELFDNRNFGPFKEMYRYNLSSIDDFVVDDRLFECIWNAMIEEGKYGALDFKGGNNLQTALEKLFMDWNYIHYTVKSGNDTIERMSPGKKALVLLELIVNVEQGKSPILIDQPEDDLDNRSIFSELVQYLKRKKHERQIVVVTHNANVVIGADAEEVIIANQDGDEVQNNESRFEYRCGAIENNLPVYDLNGAPKKGILNQKGIRDQICDILEGGKEAFELRQKKYSVNN